MTNQCSQFQQLSENENISEVEIGGLWDNEFFILKSGETALSEQNIFTDCQISWHLMTLLVLFTLCRQVFLELSVQFLLLAQNDECRS